MGIYGTKKDIKLGKLELSGNNIYYITSASGEAARQQTKEIFDILKRNSNASSTQGDYDGRGQQTASPMLTAIMSGGVGIRSRGLSTQLINSLEQANHSFS